MFLKKITSVTIQKKCQFYQVQTYGTHTYGEHGATHA